MLPGTQSDSDIATEEFAPFEQSHVQCRVDAYSDVSTDCRAVKLVRVVSCVTQAELDLRLEDDWARTPVQNGDIVSVIGGDWFLGSPRSGRRPTIAITMRHNFLIHHPQLLLPVTMVSEAFPCRRKPIVSSLVASPSSENVEVDRSIVWGNLMHRVTQRRLLAVSDTVNGPTNGPALETINTTIDAVVRSKEGIQQSFSARVTLPTAVMELRRRSAQAPAVDRYFFPSPATTLPLPLPAVSIPAVLSRTRDIEESIWSPTYGLAGKLDASMDVLVPASSLHTNTVVNPDALTEGVMPLEIKTGKHMSRMNHRAQVLLYSLLLRDRYGIQCSGGLLYYTSAGQIVHVPERRNELRGLVIARNELAHALTRRTSVLSGMLSSHPADNCDPELTDVLPLPDPIDDEHECPKCPALHACSLYRQISGRMPVAPSPVTKLFAAQTEHLTSDHIAFFRTWQHLVSLEETVTRHSQDDLWTTSSEAREQCGYCLAHMVYSPPCGQTQEQNDAHPDYPRLAWFAKPASAISSTANSAISSGDRVIVSLEDGPIPIESGRVITLTSQTAVIVMERPFLPTVTRVLRTSSLDNRSPFFRIDKLEVATNAALLRTNLARLLSPTPYNAKWRSLVVDLQPPRFTREISVTDPNLFGRLSATQQQAVRLGLSALDYAVIHGMPGTGKTYVIACIIQLLVQQSKSVLLTSYTHSAIDSVLSSLGNVPFHILRLGDVSKIHPDARRYATPSLSTALLQGQYPANWVSAPLVAVTSLGINHPLLARRHFDYCIVDEASQTSLPVTIGPMQLANVVILVGDHLQLPPLIVSDRARAGGLDISLFDRLSRAHPDLPERLTEQYRMNSDIMLLSNQLVYDGRLSCASEVLAHRALVFPPIQHSQFEPVSPNGWLTAVLDPKVLFFNTDNVPAPHSVAARSLQNETETTLVAHAARALLQRGLAQADLGIVTLYRQQVNLLTAALSAYQAVEILTADESQGREKECIIVSTVRSGHTEMASKFLSDPRRMNVFLTRARAKLVIFGSRRTLSFEGFFAKLFDLIEEQGWMYNLQPSDHLIAATSDGTDILQSRDQL